MPGDPVHVAPRPVDPRALARIRARLQAAPGAPWLHQEVARRMADRLGLIRHAPATWLAWDAHRGGGPDLLQAAYPRARGLQVERAPTPRGTRPWWQRLAAARPAAAVPPSDVAPGQAGLLWSNMALHLEPDPGAVFARWHEAVEVGGFLMFSTLGPGTLQALQHRYREAGWREPLAPFVDMHDLGDLLVACGWAEPVMDQELLTLTWDRPEAALAELRGLGGNADRDRFAGLRTPRWRSRLLALLSGLQGADGRVQLTFEVVYGHAFRAAPKVPVRAETRVDAEVLRGLARQPRKA